MTDIHINFKDLHQDLFKIISLKSQMQNLKEQTNDILNNLAHKYEIKTTVLRKVVSNMSKNEQAKQNSDLANYILEELKRV